MRTWNIFIFIAMLSSLTACMTNREADNNRDSDDNKSPQSDQPPHVDGNDDSPTSELEKSILAKFQVRIIQNGILPSSHEPSQSKIFVSQMKEIGQATLLAASNVRTEWQIELQNKNQERFYSKFAATQDINGELHHSKNDNSEHTYHMNNFFTHPGKTVVSFKIVPQETCHKKHSQNTCKNIDSVPSDLVATLKIPIEVIDIGRQQPATITLCDAVGYGYNIVGALTSPEMTHVASKERTKRLNVKNSRCPSP
ncbi:MAG: hypothetical protein OXC44_04865 [Proteobacteria bacterium]|nr:hypothetical protein [Pseudomonadota bacterium]